jgi:hypothetical protein
MNPSRSYTTVRDDELKHAVMSCYRNSVHPRGITSVSKSVRKHLNLNALDLGPKIETYRNSWDAAVAHAIIDLCAEGQLLKEKGGEWKYNEDYLASLVKAPVDPNSLTAVGRAQKAIMEVFKELGDLRMGRADLIALASERCNHAPSTVDAAITKYSKHGEGYLEIPMIGIVAVTAKGQKALDEENYEFEKRPVERYGQIKTAYPEEELKILLLYLSAVSPYRSQKQRDLATHCAGVYTLDVGQVVGTQINDVKPFERHCYEMLKKLKKDGYLDTPFGFGGALQITDLGWRKLKTDGVKGQLTLLGFEVPTEVPLALKVNPIIESISTKAQPIQRSFLNGSKENHKVIEQPVSILINKSRVPDQPVVMPSEPEKTTRLKSSDPLTELNAMKAITDVLASLDELTQKRVLNWINERYGNE